MKTTNMFRTLLMAVALLLGVNQVKADEVIWETTMANYDKYNDISLQSQISKFQNVKASDKLRLYFFNRGISLTSGLGTGYEGALNFTDYNSEGKYFEFQLSQSDVDKLKSSSLSITASDKYSAVRVVLIDPNGNAEELYSENDGPIYGAWICNSDRYPNISTSYKIRVYATFTVAGSVRLYGYNGTWNFTNCYDKADYDRNYKDCSLADGLNGYVDITFDAATAENLKVNDLHIKQDGLGVYAVHLINGEADNRSAVSLSFADNVAYIGAGTQNVSGPALTSSVAGLDINYSSSNTSVATVSADGKVTGVAPGMATIKASFDGNSSYKSAEAQYTLVVKHAFSATTEGSSLWTGSVYFGDWKKDGIGDHATIQSSAFSNVKVGDKLRFYGTFETLHNNFWQLQVNNNSWQQIAFAQANDSFSNGYVDIEVTSDILSGLGNGNVYIQGYNLTLAAVTLIAGTSPTTEEKNYSITVNPSITNGTVTANPTSAKAGDTVTLTATPSSGYQFGSWDVRDASSNSITVTNNQFTMPASNVTVSATFTAVASTETEPANISSSTGYATFSCTKALDFSSVTALTAYIATEVNSSTVKLVPVTGTVAAGTGLVIKGSSANIPVVDSGTDYSSTNKLVAVSSTTTVSGSNKYVLVQSGNEAKFAVTTLNSATLTAGHAYLQTSAGARARSLSISFGGDDGTTGVDNFLFDDPQSDDAVYDLSGRKLPNNKLSNGQMPKGIYIINGRKVVIK